MTNVHLEVLICMVRALLYCGSVNLTNRGQQAQSQQRRLSRWLQNPNIVVSELCKRCQRLVTGGGLVALGHDTDSFAGCGRSASIIAIAFTNRNKPDNPLVGCDGLLATMGVLWLAY